MPGTATNANHVDRPGGERCSDAPAGQGCQAKRSQASEQGREADATSRRRAKGRTGLGLAWPSFASPASAQGECV